MSSTRPELSFAELNLPQSILDTLNKVGYEKPSPIQQATIPVLLSGKDVVGMAQTGTGKTAAFALPILAKIDVSQMKTQALVLCPTRELAIQVAEAFQTYAAGMRGFHVLPVYGGQDMQRQLTGLRRGAHVVVGTPGRLLDHLNRKSMDLSQLNTLVLDEADEMLRMGFIDDVETILEKTPSSRQVALFSATMPKPIRAVAEKYLKDPEEIRIASSVTNNPDIEQFYWLVQGTNKLDALTRILEVEDFDGMIIFVRTKTSTVELADKLNARGFSAAPLNGDMNQAIRIRTVEQLKSGALDIVVATDVAARGLDVERISHVMNFDIPYDDEAYVHRIGRTGRAGRSGKAFLFVAPRERRLLQSIEKTTGKKIAQMELPTRGELIMRRSAAFKEGITETVKKANLGFFHKLVEEMCKEHECSIEDVAAAMAYMLQKERPLEPSISDVKAHIPSSSESDNRPRRIRDDRPGSDSRGDSRGSSRNDSRGDSRTDSRSESYKDRPARKPIDRDSGASDAPSFSKGRETRSEPREARRESFSDAPRESYKDKPRAPRRDAMSDDDRPKPLREHPDVPMERYRIQVGHNDGVTPREIVGAIANEADMEGKYIGHIRIYDDYTTVDLPDGMPKEVFEVLQKTRVCNKALKIERHNEKGVRPSTGAKYVEPEVAAEKKVRKEKVPFTKDGGAKDGGVKDSAAKDSATKDDGFNDFGDKPAFKKPAFSKSAPRDKEFSKERPAKVRFDDSKPSAGKPAAGKTFTRPATVITPAEAEGNFTKAGAKPRSKSGFVKEPDSSRPVLRKKPKAKSARVDKDKGKRRTPKPKTAE